MHEKDGIWIISNMIRMANTPFIRAWQQELLIGKFATVAGS